MKVLKRCLAMAVIFLLLAGMVLIGSQMEDRQSGQASAVQAKAKVYKYKSSTLKVKRGEENDLRKDFSATI